MYAIDIVAPIAVYLVLHTACGVGEFAALVVAAAITGVNGVVTTIRHGKLDIVGVLVVLELLVSLGFVLATRSPRVLLYRPAVLVGLGGLYAVGTTLWGKPLGYLTTLPMVVRGDRTKAARYEQYWRTDAKFRFTLRSVTLAWGIAFVVDGGVRLYYAIAKSVDAAVLDPQLIEFGLIGAAAVVSGIQVQYVRRLFG